MYVPSPHGEYATETDMFLRTVQLNCITLQESALPFQVWTCILERSVYDPLGKSVSPSQAQDFYSFPKPYLIYDGAMRKRVKFAAKELWFLYAYLKLRNNTSASKGMTKK